MVNNNLRMVNTRATGCPSNKLLLLLLLLLPLPRRLLKVSRDSNSREGTLLALWEFMVNLNKVVKDTTLPNNNPNNNNLSPVKAQGVIEEDLSLARKVMALMEGGMALMEG